MTFLAALLLLPALARGKCQSQGTKCLNNMRQLALAGLMYADDSRGLWFPNQPESDSGTPTSYDPTGAQVDWVTVNVDWSSRSSTNTTALVTQANTPAAKASGLYSLFTPYLANAAIYKCPADPSIVNNPGVAKGPRCRSYAASQAVGTCWVAGTGWNTYNNGPVTGQWLGGVDSDSQTYGYCYQKTSQMIHPGPANLWVFSEEHADSINDNSLAVQIETTSYGGDFIDCPANYHSGAGAFTFADGHVEMHHWVGSILGKAPFVQGGPFSAAFPNTTVLPSGNGRNDLRDLNWLQARTSYPQNSAFQASYPKP